jgi:hypothetical protein
MGKGETMFTLSHPIAADKYEEGFPAAEPASNHPKQLAAIDLDGAFSANAASHFSLDSPKL